jgi:predicted nucleic acid-binding protein
VSEGTELALTEVVMMELLTGARGDSEAAALRKRFGAFTVLPLDGLAGFEAAAALYRACRSAGETVRKITDCLVAVPVIRSGATLLQADRDFEVIARHTPLQLEPIAP